jgi:sec-independent protein translocase protein TatA
MPVGPPELLIILVILLVLFGGAKLPQLARSLGTAKQEFDAGQREARSARPGPPEQGSPAA